MLHPSASTESPRSQVVGWRKHLKVHPAAELFPLMKADELRELAADIKKHGLRERAVVRFNGDRTPELLDGRNRLDALEMLGIKIDVATSFRLDGDGGFFTDSRGVYDDPVAYVVSKNIHRRHLTAEQKRDLIAKLLVANPKKSNSQIAKTAHADDKTVATVRRTLEGRSEIPNVETRTDTKGRKQPAKKQPKPVGKRPEESGHEAVYATQLRLLEHEWANASAVAKQRFVSAHADEIAALLKPATGGASS